MADGTRRSDRRTFLRYAASAAAVTGGLVTGGLAAAPALGATASTWVKRKVQARGLTFEVLVGGPETGRAVLLLHGWPENASMWDKVVPFLHRAGLRTFALNQRGYSPGARPADVEAYRQAEAVADVLAVMDALSLRRVDLVGQDWGAIVSWQIAHLHPHRVRTLTATSVPHPAAYYWAYLNDAEQQAKSAYIELFRQPPPVPENFLLANDAAELRAALAPLPAAVIDTFVTPLQAPGALTPTLHWYRALDLPALGGLGTISVPTTYVYGTGDVGVSAAAARRCGRSVTGPFRYLELPGASHWLPEQMPDVISREIVARIRSRIWPAIREGGRASEV